MSCPKIFKGCKKCGKKYTIFYFYEGNSTSRLYATSQCTMHEYMIKFKCNLLAVVSPDEPTDFTSGKIFKYEMILSFNERNDFWSKKQNDPKCW